MGEQNNPRRLDGSGARLHGSRRAWKTKLSHSITGATFQAGNRVAYTAIPFTKAHLIIFRI